MQENVEEFRICPKPNRRRRIENKVVIVTGAASGVGSVSARLFALEGAKVCVADIDINGAEKVAQKIREKYGEAFAYQVNISVEDDNKRMVQETIKRYGEVN